MNSMMFILLLKKTQILFKLPKFKLPKNPSVKEKGVQATNIERLLAKLEFNVTWSMPNLFKLE